MSQLKDLTGRLFGFLSVQRRLPNYVQPNGRTRTRWLTLCLLCGNAYVADGSHMLHGDIISCGCLKNMKSAQRGAEHKGEIKEIEDLTGQIFGYLEVLERCENLGKRTAWLCKCLLCGNMTKVRSNHLKRGLVISDGCAHISKNHKKILDSLKEANVKFKTECTFESLHSSKGHPLRFDFVLFDKNNKIVCVLEYQGEQHDNDETGEFGKMQREETDKLKIDYCLENHITYKTIWYYQDIDKEIKNIIKFYRKSTTVPRLK